MNSRDNSEILSDEMLNQIIQKYSRAKLEVSRAYGDGGAEPLWPRFERAVFNQMDGGDATLSRYAIWANTVRDNIIKALALIEEGRVEEAKPLLTRAANALSAFSDVQAYFDPMEMGQKR